MAKTSSASNPKTLLVLTNGNMQDLHAQPLTGMSFYIMKNNDGFLAIDLDGVAFPFFNDPNHYCLDDLLQGIAVPTQRSNPTAINTSVPYASRYAAIVALQRAQISRKYVGTSGAFPLIGSDTLAKKTVFRRYLSAKVDHRYRGGCLSAGTYLTSRIDSAHADTGFGAVGRYALPIPLPYSHVIEYELPKGTTVHVGTVSPNFGQAGGGVEICLPVKTSAVAKPHILLSDY
jgi:hypothetical protein